MMTTGLTGATVGVAATVSDLPARTTTVAAVGVIRTAVIAETTVDADATTIAAVATLVTITATVAAATDVD